MKKINSINPKKKKERMNKKEYSIFIYLFIKMNLSTSIFKYYLHNTE